MKIEMGESLFYSWLRHVKECQLVQTNWKVSPQWELLHEDKLEELMTAADTHFSAKYDYQIFKQNRSLAQIVRQGECDALGIAILNGTTRFYAVDVAFHGAGLNYGAKKETVMKVIAKSIRTAICLCGYMDALDAEIIFASPKIDPAVLRELEPCIKDVNDIFRAHGLAFTLRLIANETFNDSVLQPILLVSDGVADTSELFLRSYQLFTMFADEKGYKVFQSQMDAPVSCRSKKKIAQDDGIYKELKIGKLAQTVLRRMLEDGAANKEEVQFMQQMEYSKQMFDLQYPLLARADSNYDRARYYVAPLHIRGEEYLLCSQWYETAANNDRPYLVKWIKEHTKDLQE